jgi:hypothetical protein
MSRGRDANTLYLAAYQPADEECIHLTHPDRKDPLHTLTISLDRNSAQTAGIDHPSQPVPDDIDYLKSPALTDGAAQAAWLAARRTAEQDGTQPWPLIATT